MNFVLAFSHGSKIVWQGRPAELYQIPLNHQICRVFKMEKRKQLPKSPKLLGDYYSLLPEEYCHIEEEVSNSIWKTNARTALHCCGP